MRIQLLACAIAIAGSAGMLTKPVHAQVIFNSGSGSCSSQRTLITAANALDQTTSTAAWVNVGGAGSVTFVEDRTGCVTGTFSGVAGTQSPGKYLRMQILLDGANCEPVNGNLGFGSEIDAHSIGFICSARVAPGTHTLQVQYRADPGSTATIFQRTLEVQHN